MKKQKIIFIETCDIAPGALQPRTEFDNAKIDELAESIRLHGVMQPVTVRKRKDVRVIELNGISIKSEKYELVAGERRWRAAKKLGVNKIPCIVSDADDKYAALMSLVENLQREDLEFFDCAEALKKVQDQFGIPQHELARKLSMSQSNLANKLRLLRLCGEERAIIREAGLSERHAREFLRVEDDELRLLLLKKAAADKLPVSSCCAMIDAAIAPKNEEDQSKKRGHGIKYAFMIKDIRFFINSVDRSIKLLSQAGVPVERQQQEDGDFLEIRLRIPKTSVAARL